MALRFRAQVFAAFTDHNYKDSCSFRAPAVLFWSTLFMCCGGQHCSSVLTPFALFCLRVYLCLKILFFPAPLSLSSSPHPLLLGRGRGTLPLLAESSPVSCFGLSGYCPAVRDGSVTGPPTVTGWESWIHTWFCWPHANRREKVACPRQSITIHWGVEVQAFHSLMALLVVVVRRRHL